MVTAECFMVGPGFALLLDTALPVFWIAETGVGDEAEDEARV
jgi:hypothetical protein